MTAAALFWSYYDSHAVSPVVERVAPLRWIRRIYRGVIRRAHALVGGPKGDREATDDMIQNWDVLSCDSDERLARLKRDVRDERRRQSDVESERMQHFATITQPGHASALEGLDKLCAAAGLEPRYPFFDKRLVEFCLSVPGRLKLRDGWGRWIMRKAMDGILPPEIQWRSDKTDFSDAVCGAAAHEGASELKALMEFDPNQAWPHLNKAAIERLYQHFDRVPTPARYRVLFPVITILAWYRHLKSEHRTSLVVGAKSEN
jgi:asparagine synthase (glutamine-hydrolysing)